MLDLKKLGSGLLAAGLLAALPGGALAQGVNNSINLAVAAIPKIGDLGASVVMLEYERLVGRNLSVFVRGSSLKYKWDDDVYVEDGKGTGFGAGVRFFVQGGMKGFYAGAALSSFKSKWDWTETSPVGAGSGETKSIQWGAEVGYRFNLGSERISVTPAINLGSWLGADDTCTNSNGTPCTKESELGFYVVPSLSLNIAF
ncbi:MAG: autotransporter outer membrane beta-barrel domain-containing protein [Burkholderiales bacterium]